LFLNFFKFEYHRCCVVCVAGGGMYCCLVLMARFAVEDSLAYSPVEEGWGRWELRLGLLSFLVRCLF